VAIVALAVAGSVDEVGGNDGRAHMLSSLFGHTAISTGRLQSL